MHESNTGPWTEEPDADARRIAEKRRKARIAKDTHWLTVEQALKIEATTDPTRLRMELKLGLPCRYRRRDRWLVWKPQEEVAPLLAGRNPLDLQDGQWELVVHERYWRERLGKIAAPAPMAEVPLVVTDTATDPVELSPSMPPVETPALSSAPGPQAEQPLPPPKARATKRTTIEEYTAFQNDYLKKYSVYASKKTEKGWAKGKGCSAQHVRTKLRPQYRDGLPPAEQAKFQSHSKKPPDDGP
jgi:hypothetical protein